MKDEGNLGQMGALVNDTCPVNGNVPEAERDRPMCAIQAIARTREVDCCRWIEPYPKIKNGTTYAYNQLRWLTGQRKPSGQPLLKGKQSGYYESGNVESQFSLAPLLHLL